MAPPDSLFARTRHLPTPFVVLDLAAVRRSVRDLRAALPGLELFYAVKCNPHPQLLDALAADGVGLEVASPVEARLALARVSPDRIACLHPVKSAAFVRELAVGGVRTLAVDSLEELEKVAAHAPGCGVFVRLAVSNAGSRHPLAGKFGCPPADAVTLLARVARLGLEPLGPTVHVGSQCQHMPTWAAAVEACRRVADAAGVRTVSLGGGFPARYADDPDPGELIRAVGRLVADAFPPDRFRVTAEPGRAVVAAAGTLVAEVIGVARRADGDWAYLDAGIHHGLAEARPAAGGFRHPVRSEHPDQPARLYTLAGPTCDGADVVARGVSLPELQAGDRLACGVAGAYSTALCTGFNGCPAPLGHIFTDLAGGAAG